MHQLEALRAEHSAAMEGAEAKVAEAANLTQNKTDQIAFAKAEAEPARSRPGLACVSAWARLALVQASTAPSGSVAAGFGGPSLAASTIL